MSVVKQNSSHTIGVEFASKIVRVGSHVVKLQIWDTAGQERFRSVTKSYYRGAAGALLVFDLTNRKSFESLKEWLRDARTLANPNIIIVLVGNKADLEQNRQVPFMEASKLANEFCKCHCLLFVMMNICNNNMNCINRVKPSHMWRLALTLVWV